VSPKDFSSPTVFISLFGHFFKTKPQQPETEAPEARKKRKSPARRGEKIECLRQKKDE
jgi:hypothetical protein